MRTAQINHYRCSAAAAAPDIECELYVNLLVFGYKLYINTVLFALCTAHTHTHGAMSYASVLIVLQKCESIRNLEIQIQSGNNYH